MRGLARWCMQAAVMNLLSIGAAMGVIVAVFQWGWLGGLLGVQKGPIEPWVPVLMFAVVFGLSMDYEVFLISRMREQWLRREDASLAVADGIALTGRVITVNIEGSTARTAPEPEPDAISLDEDPRPTPAPA